MKNFIAFALICTLCPLSLHSEDRARLAGNGSHEVEGQIAFELHFPSISPRLRSHFQSGNSFFKQNWVAAPASTEARAGLGPLFNARSCSSCHLKDGRGSPDFRNGLLLKLMVPHDNGFVPSTPYGGQFQDQSTHMASVEKVLPEGRVEIIWHSQSFTYPDGNLIELRHPEYVFYDLAYGELEEDIKVSARLAPQVIGLGLIEAIPSDDLFAEEERQKKDPDVSGRVVRLSSGKLGRFGWRADQPDLRHQSAAAFRNDMGLSNSIFPDENCEAHQDACRKNAHTKQPFEVDEKILDRIETYLRYLAVPNRRLSAESLAGEEVFNELKCQTCHRPSWTTGTGENIEEAIRDQQIYPYTDLLLHDMGPELADQFSSESDLDVFREWRTPPLWGIGLVQEINPSAGFLHDGRARSLEEAILWHGGEASASKNKFTHLPEDKRQLLLQFLKSL